MVSPTYAKLRQSKYQTENVFAKTVRTNALKDIAAVLHAKTAITVIILKNKTIETQKDAKTDSPEIAAMTITAVADKAAAATGKIQAKSFVNTASLIGGAVFLEDV